MSIYLRTTSQSYKQFLILHRKFDQSLKFLNSFNQFKTVSLDTLRLSLNVLQPEDEAVVIKSLDFLTRLSPFSSFRAVSLDKIKKFSSNTPIQFFSTLRDFTFFSFVQSLYKLSIVSKTKHTFHSDGFSANSINIALGNLGEIVSNLNPNYEYFKWLSVLNSTFCMQNCKGGADLYYFSIFGLYQDPNYLDSKSLILNHEAFSF